VRRAWSIWRTVISVEVLDGAPAPGHGERIDLNDVARLLKGDVLRLADGVRASFRGACAADLSDQFRNRRHLAALDQALENTADGCVGDDEAGLAQQWSSLSVEVCT
jgi:hypothetical protein